MMKKTNIFAIIGLLLMTCCFAKPYVVKSQDLDFGQWHKKFYLEFIKLSENNKATYKFSERDEKMVHAYMKDSTLKRSLEIALRRNRLKNWQKLYITEHLIESTSYYNLEAFIFYDNNKIDGTLVFYYLGGVDYLDIGKVSETKFKGLTSRICGHQSPGFLFISVFNRKFENIDNKILLDIYNSTKETEFMNEVYKNFHG